MMDSSLTLNDNKNSQLTRWTMLVLLAVCLLLPLTVLAYTSPTTTIIDMAGQGNSLLTIGMSGVSDSNLILGNAPLPTPASNTLMYLLTAIFVIFGVIIALTVFRNRLLEAVIVLIMTAVGAIVLLQVLTRLIG